MNLTRVLVNIGGLVGVALATTALAQPPATLEPATPPPAPTPAAPAVPATPAKEAEPAKEAQPARVMSKEAGELIEKAKAAGKAAKDVSATTEMTMKFDGKSQTQKGKIVVVFSEGDQPLGKWRLEPVPAKAGATAKIIASDGKTIRVINTAKKEMTETATDDGNPQGEEGMLLPMWFLEQRNDMMGRTTVVEQVIEGDVGGQKIGDEKVTVVRQIRTMRGNQGTDTSRLYLGADNLPRKVERTIEIKSDEGAFKQEFTQTFADLKVNTSPAADVFALKAPEGFKTRQIDPNAPNLSVSEGEQALEFSLKDADGKEYKLADFKGKVVLMDFWATWCPPCRAAMPNIQKIFDEFKDKAVAVIGVDTSEKNDTDGPAYIKKEGFTYLNLFKGDELATSYGISGIPTMLLIDKDGKLLHITVGFDPKEIDELKKIINEKLAK